VSDIQDLVSDPTFVAAPTEKQASILGVFFDRKLEGHPATKELPPDVISQTKDAFVKKFTPDPRSYLLGGAGATIGPVPKDQPAPPPEPSFLDKVKEEIKTTPDTLKQAALDATKAALGTPKAAIVLPAKLATGMIDQEQKDFTRRGIILEGKGDPRTPLESAAEIALRSALLGGVVNRSDQPRSLKNTLLDILEIGGTAGGLVDLAPLKALRAAKVVKNVAQVAQHIGPEEAELLGKVAGQLSENPVAAQVLKGTMPEVVADAAAPVMEAPAAASADIVADAARPRLPIVAPGSKEGAPHAVFAYNDDYGPNNTTRAIYNVFGDPTNPAVQKVGWGSSVSRADIDAAGIPIVGREPRAAANNWMPAGEPVAARAPEVGAEGAIPPPSEPPPPPPPGGTPPEPPPGPSGAAPTPPPGPAGDMGQFNVDRFLDPDVRNILRSAQDIPEIQQKIIAAKRGLVTDEQVKQLASTVGVSAESLRDMAPGSVLNAEGLYKANQILGGVGKSAANLAEKYHAAYNAGDAAAMGAVVSDTQKLMDPLVTVLVKTRAIASELGRALRQQRIVIDELSPMEKSLLSWSAKDGEGMFSPEKAEELLRKITATHMDPEQIAQIFVQTVKPTLTDKIVEVATAFKLTNPMTYVRNLTGNVMAVMTNLSERAVGGPIDLLRSTFTGTPRERYLGEVGAQLFGLNNGLHDAAIQFMATLRGIPSAGKTAEVMRAPAVGGMAGKVIQVPFKILNATDDFFKTILRRGELYGQALRQAAKEGKIGPDRWARVEDLVANPPSKWINAIEDKVLEFTYQTPLGPLGTLLDKSRSTFGGLPKLIVPFFKTPVNIGKFIVQRTPMGVFPGSRNWEAFVRGGGEASEAAARLTVGTALSGLFTWMGVNGYITGSGPTDKAKKDLLMRQGWQPHALHIGGKYISVSGFDPLASALGTAGDVAEAWFNRKETPPIDTIAKMGWGVANNITDQPFLTGVHDFLDALRDERKMGKFVDNFVAGFVPSGVGLMARQIDPVMRKPVGIVQSVGSPAPVP
jgi:hypothetical protein